jgi:predicted CXXCH cytochrome family protein
VPKQYIPTVGSIAALAVCVSLAMAGCDRGKETAKVVTPPIQHAAPLFVDEIACVACHANEVAQWQGSHHASAMQKANEKTVSGDFNNVTFRAHDVANRFTQHGDKYVVTTDGSDGKPADFDVKFTFGVTPLQQYLVEAPGGRLQALSTAWDTQNKRWFHLYPNEQIDHRDELHWTKPAQNWNFMCAECHSTDVRKNYDAASDQYNTQYFQINVGCQACHGPASAHIEWTKNQSNTGSNTGMVRDAHTLGFVVDLKSSNATEQIESCALCHSRRSTLISNYTYGRPLMDSHLPALLQDPLYYADGQIREEVFEYGSFLQSRMHQKGLRCSDCHNAHSATLKAPGNALCVTCHNERGPSARVGIDTSGLKKKNYDSEQHYFHGEGKPGSQCIECHAPSTKYMVIDPRIDHSFRIPRPDLSTKLKTPNACNRCHRDRSPEWAAKIIEQRHPDYHPTPHYGEALHAGRTAAEGAVASLTDLIADHSVPPIVRASAIELLANYPGAITSNVLSSTLHDSNPLIRRAAVASVQSMPGEQRRYWLTPFLHDSILAIRIEAARILLETGVDSAQQPELASALTELAASYRTNQDHPEGRSGLAYLFAVRGQLNEAEAMYRSAIAFEPIPLHAAVNFADFYRATQREADAEALLRKTLAAHPRNPAVTYALAMSLVRQARKSEALQLLAPLATSDASIAYPYALLLDSMGKRQQAIQLMERVLPNAHDKRDLLLALASLHSQSGANDKAAQYIRDLTAINPYDPEIARAR